MAADEPEKTTPTDAPQDQAAESSTEPKMSPEKLKEILEAHKQWLESEDRKKWDEAPSEEKAKYENGRANLQGAWLTGATLQGAVLWKADLQRAMLWKTDLQRAVLENASLQGARLWKANLQGAHLGAANLEGAGLAEANLQKAVLHDTVLREANLQDANLTGATGLLANSQEPMSQERSCLQTSTSLRDWNTSRSWQRVRSACLSLCSSAASMPG